jgi:hypothetical protein
MVAATSDGIEIGNRFAIQPMEGWEGLPDGNQSENWVLTARGVFFQSRSATVTCGQRSSLGSDSQETDSVCHPDDYPAGVSVLANQLRI